MGGGTGRTFVIDIAGDNANEGRWRELTAAPYGVDGGQCTSQEVSVRQLSR
jgi:hypothetical protein